MKKEMFQNILQKDEEVIWSAGVNKSAYIVKRTFASGVLMLFIVLALFSTGPVCGIITTQVEGEAEVSVFLKTLSILWGSVIGVGLIISFLRACLNSSNTFFAITNKRIIKRSGVFNNKFMHYSLKNVGNVGVVGSVFDKKGENASANIIITIKDFHNNTNSAKLDVTSLENAYDAYKILAEETEGNNEVLRVKTEK